MFGRDTAPAAAPVALPKPQRTALVRELRNALVDLNRIEKNLRRAGAAPVAQLEAARCVLVERVAYLDAAGIIPPHQEPTHG